MKMTTTMAVAVKVIAATYDALGSPVPTPSPRLSANDSSRDASMDIGPKMPGNERQDVPSQGEDSKRLKRIVKELRDYQKKTNEFIDTLVTEIGEWQDHGQVVLDVRAISG